MPNYIMFQIGVDMPSTNNELRDSCRSHVPPAVQKYSHELLELISKKVNREPKVPKSTKHLNVKFDAPVRTETKAILLLENGLKKCDIKVKVSKTKHSQSRLFLAAGNDVKSAKEVRIECDTYAELFKKLTKVPIARK